MRNYQLLYYVVPKESFQADGRVFFKNEMYPVYDKNCNSLLVAENGDFLFTNQLMKKVIEEWDLEIKEI